METGPGIQTTHMPIVGTAMKPELWEMMNVVFHHAVDLTETERRLYLQKIQNENPDVYQHVDGLLHYHFKETELSLEGDAETRLKQIVHATARILNPIQKDSNRRIRRANLSLDELSNWPTSNNGQVVLGFGCGSVSDSLGFTLVRIAAVRGCLA